jgi:hypothetical protein
MFCPICRAEFREGFTECNTCRVKLVEDPDNLTEKVEGEFLLCRACKSRFEYGEAEYCKKCGFKLVRTVYIDDEFVFLEKPVNEFNQETVTQPDEKKYEHLVRLEDDKAVVLIESDDKSMFDRIQNLLDHNGIDFDVRIPAPEGNPLGSILGGGSKNPLEQEFPKILVKIEDEEKAVDIITEDEELGLGELPPELQEEDQ